MNEGSRHEKVALVIASYIIGFTAAFILYADFAVSDIDVLPEEGVSAAAVVSALPPAAVVESEPVEVENLPTGLVSYSKGLLEVNKDGAINLLSFNPKTSDLKADISGLTQGYHYGEMTYVVSPDEMFIFFCEQHEVDNTGCAGYVYDLSAATIYPVIKNGAQPSISAQSAGTVRWTQDGLQIGSNQSVSASAPWVLKSE